MHKPTALIIFALLSLHQVLCNSTPDPLLLVINQMQLNDNSTPVPGNATAIVSNEDIHEALAFGDQVIYIISSKLVALPDDMQLIGERILTDVKKGVQYCEDDLRRNGTIWEYKVCCSSQLRYGISSFAGFMQGSAASGASRPGLFFM